MKPNSYPLVSVLIPLYNCESYIADCLESVTKQDYPNFEIIIHNDGSTDQSLEICEKYAERHKNIKLYSSENQGVAAARNNLLDKINGKFFLFVDADDWIEPETILSLYEMIHKHDADIATCAFKRNHSTQNNLNIEIWDNKQTIKEFLKHKKLNGSLCNKLIKTDLLGETRFKKGIYYGEDALFTWNILQSVNRIVVTDMPLYNYRHNPNSISRQNWTADKKGTGYIVWREICEDVKKNHKQFLNIALSRCALEDMWALYFASQSNWPKDKSIILRQNFIKAHRKELNDFRLDGDVAYYTSILLSRCYKSGQLIYWINTLLRKFR